MKKVSEKSTKCARFNFLNSMFVVASWLYSLTVCAHIYTPYVINLYIIICVIGFRGFKVFCDVLCGAKSNVQVKLSHCYVWLLWFSLYILIALTVFCVNLSSYRFIISIWASINKIVVCLISCQHFTSNMNIQYSNEYNAIE